jgi:flavin reductase (DIM6/NTAB) family NADH-FMN oxidoreductase RutF
MIEQCPVNIECMVVHTIKLGSHDIFIGQIQQTYVSEQCLTDGKADISKIKPIVYSADPSRNYYAVGELIGKGFDSGKKMIKKK